MLRVVSSLATLLLLLVSVQSFSSLTVRTSGCTRGLRTTLDMSKNGDGKPRNFFEDLMGMFSNFDDVVDDFVMKRMGNGEQFYGKRKYNPSGDYDGDYNGMGQSSHYAIEIARVKKEVLEERRQRRLEEEAAARSAKNSS